MSKRLRKTGQVGCCSLLPALESADVPHRPPYALRHTFATNALSAGLSIFELSRYMGTSLQMVDATYGHLAQGSEEVARSKLDALESDRFDQDLTTDSEGPLNRSNEKTRRFQRVQGVGGTGLEPVTPSLSNRCGLQPRASRCCEAAQPSGLT